MDFPYTANENDWHEVKLLKELQELSLCSLTQERWYNRKINEESKGVGYSRNRRKAEKHAQKRFNVLGDIQDDQDNLLNDDDEEEEDGSNLSDIDESQMEKALGPNDVEQWKKKQAEDKETKSKLLQILNKGKKGNNVNTENDNVVSTTELGERKKFTLERSFMTEEERVKEEIRLQKECNELYFKHVLDKNYDEVEKILNGGGAEIDYINEHGLSSLHVCCSNGDFKMLEYLLKEYKERGLDINDSKKGYRYPVYTHALTATMCK